MVVLTNNELETIVVLTHETHEPSHLDGDEMPHMQQCLKDVALEEVEDVHAHDYDENDNEMEICNLVDTKIVKESGREMGEGGGCTQGIGELLVPKLDHKPLVILHLTQLLFMPMKLERHLLPVLAFSTPHLHLMHLMW